MSARPPGRERQPAAGNLSQGGQVRRNSVDFLSAALRAGKSGNHLVENKQRALLSGYVPVLLGIRSRWDAAHVAGDGLNDHAGDLARIPSP